MKKLLSILLLVFMMLNLSSCVVLYSFGQIMGMTDQGVDSDLKYSPCPEDFEKAEAPLGTTCAFTYFVPTKDAFYYIDEDFCLYRADSEGTKTVEFSNMTYFSTQLIDPWLRYSDDKLYFTAFDESSSKSGKLYCYENGSEEPKLLAETKCDYGNWDIYKDSFVYIPYEADYDSETYPYNLYTLTSLDLKSSKSKEISKDNVVDFKIVDGKLIFVTYDEKNGFEVSSCDPDGNNMALCGKVDMEYNSKYGYIDAYHITEDYVVLWGDTGVGSSETDLVVFSLETAETKLYEFPLYSSTFVACKGYGFITFVREDEDPLDNPEPMDNEGIFRIDLATGETELVSKELAFNSALVAFDEDCVYVQRTHRNELTGDFITEYSRIKTGEKPTLVYSYDE
ncbi:MAG: hypothetical protein IJF69_05755 [Clostridia bacterium]|nr:hypothetical protein [Clostridia bacterium]